MKTTKKSVTLIILSAIILSLAACGSNEEAKKTALIKDVQAEIQAVNKEDTAKEDEEELPETEDEKITATKDEEPTVEENSQNVSVPSETVSASSQAASSRTQPSAQPGNSSEQPHKHNWTAHTSQRWVSQIVTVVDEPERSEKYARFKFYWYNTGTWEETRDPARFEEWANSEYGQLYPFYHIQNIEDNPLFLGYNELGQPSFRGDHVMSEGWDVIPAVTHEEDQGYYETYVDYYYCDCGATK